MRLKSLSKHTSKELSNREYHTMEGVSSTMIKTYARLGGESLAHWQNTHPTDSTTFEFGTAAHAYILEGHKPAVWPEAGVEFTGVDGKPYTMTAGLATKVAATFKATIPEGEPLLTGPQWAQLQEMRAMTLADEYGRRFLHEGTGEVESSFFAIDEDTGLTVKCRPDRLILEPQRTIIVDYKTSKQTFQGQEEEDIERQTSWVMRDYLYTVQAWWYREIIRAHGYPNPVFVFVFQSKTGPYFLVSRQPTPAEYDIAGELVGGAVAKIVAEKAGLVPNISPLNVGINIDF